MVVTDSTPPSDCPACPRLVALRARVREQYPDYHAAPVNAWGRPDARLLVVGLAPGLHGANRTGRPFTGDASGEFLFRALKRAGFADITENADTKLINARITNAVKCLPPHNRPVTSELRACLPFLASELQELTGQRPRRNRVVLCLGRQAHHAVSLAMPSGLPAFGHGRIWPVGSRLFVVDTYHPSRLNTNTGRLTETMLDTVLRDVIHCLAP